MIIATLELRRGIAVVSLLISLNKFDSFILIYCNCVRGDGSNLVS